MIKRDELAAPSSCLNKADAVEPIFVLRGKDAVAAMAVRHWATMAHGVHEAEKISEALDLAEQMEKWRASQDRTATQLVGPDLTAPRRF